MLQVRIHGRGGQGVVTAAELLAQAAFTEGRYAQAFPTFGSERTGAPVVSFCRIDDRPIRVREPIAEPDALIVQDPTLVHQVDLFAGLGGDAYVVINTSRSVAELGLGRPRGAAPAAALVTVPASEIAREHLGRPLPNAALLGAFAALTGDRRARLRRRGDPRQVPRRASATRTPQPPRPRTPSSRHARRRPSVRRQLEGSLAVAQGGRRLPARGDLGVPDLAPDAHRRGAVRPRPHRRARALRVPDGRVRVRRHVGRHRRVGRRRALLHGDREPGAALHGRGALQRLRARAADRDDGRQPRDRRADQHLERPQRLDVAARLAAGSSSTPSRTRRRSTCTSRRSGWRRSCRCR